MWTFPPAATLLSHPSPLLYSWTHFNLASTANIPLNLTSLMLDPTVRFSFSV